MSHIRQIGDKILHQPPKPVDWTSEEDIRQLQQDIAIMELNLRETGGVGIAANQCADIPLPLQVVIIGTNDEKTRELAATRYPDQDIPHETVMVNPKIVACSDDVYYPKNGEGCLSLAGSLRAKVKRYTQVTVEFQDVNGVSHKETLQGFAAHVVQHECDHLNGIVYFQKMLKELSVDELQKILHHVSKALNSRQSHFSVPDSLDPILVFDRQQDKVIYEENKLENVLKKTATETLKGLQSVLTLKM